MGSSLGKLILVRHANPEIEPGAEASTWRLGETGRRRYGLLACRLRGFNPSVVWSSREAKAVETAEIVAAAFEVAVEVAAGLEEHHRSGVPFFSTEAEFERAVGEFFSNPDRLVLGTETAEQALSRFAAAVDAVVKEGQNDIIVVTYGTVMTLYLASVGAFRPMWLWRRLGAPSFVVLGLPDMYVHSIVESVVL